MDSLHPIALGLWTRRWLALRTGWLVALVGFALIPLVPVRYEARSMIHVDTQSVLKPLLSGLAYQLDVDQQVRMLARTVVSRPNVEWLMEQPGLAFEPQTLAQREATVAGLMKNIRLSVGESGLYTISYRDTRPERALRIVELTLELIVKSSSRDQKRDSAGASRFIEEQIATYEIKLAEAENRLKDYKLRHFGVTGVPREDHFTRMSLLQDELDKQQADLRAARQTRDAYRRGLADEDPLLPKDRATGPGSDGELALAATRRRLDEMLGRFTDSHPDVANLRQQVDRMEAQQRAQEQAAAASLLAGTRPTAQAPTSPVYQRLRVALAESEAQVAALESRVTVENQRLAEARAVAERTPQAEAELSQLNRDYDVVRKNYEQLVARRESATLGVKLDETSRLADFRVVDPPQVAGSPVFPGRLHLALMAIALSLAAGLLAPAVAARLHPTVDDAQSLRALTGRPVLGAVSAVRPTEGRRTEPLKIALALGLLLSVQVGWLAWTALRAVAS